MENLQAAKLPSLGTTFCKKKKKDCSDCQNSLATWIYLQARIARRGSWQSRQSTPDFARLHLVTYVKLLILFQKLSTSQWELRWAHIEEIHQKMCNLPVQLCTYGASQTFIFVHTFKGNPKWAVIKYFGSLGYYFKRAIAVSVSSTIKCTIWFTLVQIRLSTTSTSLSPRQSSQANDRHHFRVLTITITILGFCFQNMTQTLWKAKYSHTRTKRKHLSSLPYISHSLNITFCYLIPDNVAYVGPTVNVMQARGIFLQRWIIKLFKFQHGST